MSRAELFAGVDRAIFAASFAGKLRNAGLDITFTSLEQHTAAIEAVGPISLDELYWVSRLSFVSEPSQLDRFNALFDALFETEMGKLPAERRGQQAAMQPAEDDRLVPLRRSLADDDADAGGGVPWATLPSITLADHTGDDADDGDETLIPELRPSAEMAEMQRPFDLLDDAELERVGELLETATHVWPQRRSRRQQTTRSGGQIAMRRSVRHATTTGGDVVKFLRTKPRRKPRRVVVLLDVSGSMESYARAYLHLTRPLAINHQAEVFAFATDLTRITPSVRLRSAADAIDGVTDVVGDRFSGTRLATSLRTLLQHRTWSTCVRGSVVLICSDGWDSDEPEQLDRSMRRLARLAHRVVWVNPRAAASGFEPRTGGMAAALPHCDHFLAGNTGNAMTDVIAALTAV